MIVGVSKETSFDASILRILADPNSPALTASRQRLIEELSRRPKPVSIGVDELTGQERSVDV